jgi:cytochrome c553
MIASAMMLCLVAGLMVQHPVAHAQSKRVIGVISLALALEPDRAHGQQIYAKHCATCHGRGGEGNPEAVTPILSGQVLTYLLKQLADMSEADRDVTEMHRLMARPELGTPQSLRDVATFLNSLAVTTVPQRGDGGRLLVGERIYKSACLSCHGKEAEGDFASAVPALRGQHYSYLMMQVRQMAVGHRYSVDPEVIGLLEALSRDELSAVSDYLSRLKLHGGDKTIAALK